MTSSSSCEDRIEWKHVDWGEREDEMHTASNSFLDRISRIARTEGLRGMSRRLLGKAREAVGIELGYILVDSLVPETPVPGPKVNVQVQQLKANDTPAVQDLSRLYEQEYGVISAEKGILERLGRGELCYFSRVEGQVSGHLWIRVSGPAANDYPEIKFFLQPDEVYYHDVYVAPDQRGKNICPAMKAASGREMAERLGKTQSVAVVLSTNHSSLNAFRKFGSKRVGVIGYLKLFGAKHPFMFSHKPVAL